MNRLLLALPLLAVIATSCVKELPAPDARQFTEVSVDTPTEAPSEPSA